MPVINIARDFSRFPSGRYKKHGDESGQGFRDDLLVPALNNDDIVTVVLDGTSGYPASFLEEAFGGLIRLGIDLEKLDSHLKIEANDKAFEIYVELAWQYIREASEANTTH